jgi:hypothetical protein
MSEDEIRYQVIKYITHEGKMLRHIISVVGEDTPPREILKVIRKTIEEIKNALHSQN